MRLGHIGRGHSGRVVNLSVGRQEVVHPDDAEEQQAQQDPAWPGGQPLRSHAATVLACLVGHAGAPVRYHREVGEHRNTELGDFLRSRRSALTPAQIGIPTHGAPRRVPGLRREEVARLAGMSVNYYTRIEQGESHQMSDSVLEAIATALRLDETERLHLLRLAWPTQIARGPLGPETVRDSLRALLDSATDQAAWVIGRRADLLAANRLGSALLGIDPGQRPNLARWLFLEPAARDLYVDLETIMHISASNLRISTREHPGDPELAELVAELCVKSPDFARIWATHPMTDCLHTVREFNHPLVGRLTLNEETFRLPDAPGQRMIFNGAEPGTQSAQRLKLLNCMAAS